MKFNMFDVFVIFAICVLLILIVGLIRFKVTGFIDKLIKKSLYSQNTKIWYKLSKVKFNINRLLPVPSRRFLMWLFLCGVICYALVRNLDAIIQFASNYSIKTCIKALNEIISDYSPIITATIFLVLFVVLLIIYSSHKNKFTKVISDFQYEELLTILKYHREIANIACDLVYKNKENIDHIALKFIKYNKAEENCIAKELVEEKFQNYTLKIVGDELIVEEKEQHTNLTVHSRYILEDITDDMDKLFDVLSRFKTENTYYPLNVFTHYKRSARFLNSLFMDYRPVEAIHKDISSKFLSNQRIKEISERIDNNNHIVEDLIKDEMINQYKSIKESLESLVVNSVNISVELEFYLQGIGKVLNIRKKKIAKGISKAIESQRS
ncbi:hypothetical protein [Ruminococcus sp.]|uniref:hypothetical protein n=1 Tax=Ruminococcus sp. TaxID=41978 RepID=UPI00388FAC4A